MANSSIPPKKIRATTPVSRPKIDPDEELKLWVRAGGRCAYCNRYLLEDEYFIYDVRSGEMAHIVGQKDSDKSPRGKNSLSAKDRDKAENLILLCATHHNLIDKKKLVGDFTVERLQQTKREHEERIYHLTDLSKDQETAVLRMIGRVRGSFVELSKETAREAVFKCENRYARFPLAIDRQTVEIDLTALPEPEIDWVTYWRAAKGIIEEKVHLLNDGLRKGDIRHISAFGFARIPLLVYLGFVLDDKVPTTIYQKHRGEGESWIWPEEDTSAAFHIEQLRHAPEHPDKVALVLSISGTIALDDLPAEVDASYNVFQITPSSTPDRNVIQSPGDLQQFERTYHEFLAKLETAHKMAKVIQLFPATPLSVGIVCGRGIMRTSQPAIAVWDRTDDGFKLALTINS